MYNIAIDFGTTNTIIGIYNLDVSHFEVFDIKKISKTIGSYRAIPTKIGYKNKNEYYIGNHPELLNLPDQHIFYKMKLYFSKFRSRPVKIGNDRIDHQQAAKNFLSLILDLILAKYDKDEIDTFIITAPVISFDKYRVFLSEICETKNIYNYQILDEPTAVALGYDAIASPDYPYMVIDFGGGTLDVNVIRLNNAKKVNAVSILGKSGSNIGGSYIDNWLLKDFLQKQNLELSDISHLKNELLDKLENLKIEINNTGISEFSIEDKKNDFEMNYRLSLSEFEQILEANYFDETIQETIDNAVESAIQSGIRKRDIKQIFLVGGSSLIKHFQKIVANNFRDKITISEPFSAVIKGGCKFISGSIVEDFLHHNYSIQHFNKNRGFYEYETIVPQKTKFPQNNVKQLIIATPFSGQEEIELKFFEVMTNIYNEDKIEDITFDENGNLIVIRDELEQDKSRKVVPLNTNTRCFITLNPPGIKSEDRIKLTFHLNQNRILLVDAIDLKTNKKYYDKFEIARLK